MDIARSLKNDLMTSFERSLQEPERLPEHVPMDQLVRIVPGEQPFPATFRMGSTDQAPEITMTLHFAMGRYAVTVEEYRGFCLATDRPSPEGRRLQLPGGIVLAQQESGPRHPVVNVSWRDAIAYCNWLENITGEPFRLPTDAEWEYACRAGTTTRYSFGDDEKDLGEYAWFNENSYSAQPVGNKKPNPWGLYDMHGNVWEWCADPWHENHTGRPSDGSVWLRGGDFSRRVTRGGSWNYVPRNLTSASRRTYDPIFNQNVHGFRISRTL